MDQNKPWLNEPNELYWEERGLKCLMKRNASKAWCGYVEIPKGHLYYDLNYDDINRQESFPAINGGITFKGEWMMLDEDKDRLFIGFDCSHAWDIIPLFEEVESNPGEMEQEYVQIIKMKKKLDEILEGGASKYINRTYKDVDFVEKEITKLVDHIIEVRDANSF